MMSLVSHPESWTEIALGEINQYRSQNVQPRDFPSEFFELWSVPIFPTGKPEILLGTEIGSSKQAVAPNDVLICKINPRINRVWEVGQKSSYRQIASSEWIIVRQPLMEPRYLRRFFQSDEFRARLCADVTGVGGSLTRAQPKKVATFPVFVPPLAEQKVIADKLDTLLAQADNTKARLERIPQILKRFRQSVLAAAVSGRLTEEFRDPEQSTEKTEKLSVPNCWNTVQLGELSEFITSGSRGWARYYSDAGSLFIRSQDINTDELEFSNPCYVRIPDNAEGQRTKVQKNDLLLTITGANVTKCARVKTDLDDAYVSQHVSLIRLADPSMAPFVELILKAPNAGRYQLKKAAYGGGKPGLNLQNIRDVNLALPEQEEAAVIVRNVSLHLAHADRIEQQVNNALTRVNNLTQSILAKAFRGELTEQWRKENPELISGENSAEALLERIKAERAAMKPANKTRKRTPA